MIQPNVVESRFVLDCLQAESLGAGMMFAAMYRDKFLFSHAAQEWYVWRGHYWERDCVGEALAAVDQVAQRVAEEITPIDAQIEAHRESKNEYLRKAAEKEKKRIIDYVRALRRKTGRADCLLFASTLPDNQGLGIRGNEFDQNIWMFGTANGVIDTRTGRHRPGRPADMITKTSPVEWQGESAPCPGWENFLAESVGHVETIAYLQRFCGYLLTGSVRDQVYLILSGEGRNGKGVFQETVSAALGGYSRAVKSELLLDQGRNKSASGPSPEIMSLYGARAAWASESNEGRRVDNGQVKLLTGGDELNGRNPNDKYEVCFKPTHKLILSTNNPPHGFDADFALQERTHHVPFDFQFVDAPRRPNQKLKIKGLAEVLSAELPGILAWMLRGCMQWQAMGGLCPPPAVLQAAKDLSREGDTVQDYIEARCWVEEMAPESVRTSATDLYLDFKEWFSTYHSGKCPRHALVRTAHGQEVQPNQVRSLFL
jgi:putative DNA primase/helicase